MLIFRTALALTYAGLIFALSASARPLGIESWPLPHLDKLLHAGEYALLFTLIRWALAAAALRQPARLRDALAVLLTVLYAASDELHQAFVPGRDADLLDLLADTVGTLVTCGLVRRLCPWRDQPVRGGDPHAA